MRERASAREHRVASRSTYRLYGFVLLAFGTSELLARLLGVRFAAETLGRLYQFLDPVILREDLARGLFHLHSQPPLFNLFMGVVLKVFPELHPVVFSWLFGAAALLLLLGMARSMRELGVSDSVNGVVCFLFAITPNFLVYRHWLFYTLPVALLLVSCGLCLLRFLETERDLYRYGFGLAALALMLVRSVYHPFWLVLVLAAILPSMPKRLRRRFAVTALLPLGMVTLWSFKNYVQVESFSTSSWVGLSLAKRWPLSQREVAELQRSGALPRVWHRRPFREPRELRGFGYFRERADGGIHPAVDAPYKTNGEPNFNHRDYAVVSRDTMAGNLYLIHRYPGRYARRVMTALLLYLQPGPNSVHFLVDYDFTRVGGYRDVWSRYLFMGGHISRPIRMLEPPLNLLVFLFPLLLVLGVARWRQTPELRPFYAFLLVTVFWVTATANLIEIGENDRMRWEIEPFLAMLLGSLPAVVKQVWRSTSGEVGRV